MLQTLIRLRNRQPTNAIPKLNLELLVVLDDLSVPRPENNRMGITLHDAFEASGVSTHHSDIFEWLKIF